MRLSCQQFLDQFVYLSISNVSNFRLSLLRVGKPLFTNSSIVPCARGVEHIYPLCAQQPETDFVISDYQSALMKSQITWPSDK